ncbi:MAG: PilT/PilU family type 4a pilus ATPase [Rhodoferax sp.]|uniref:PilT/PilU family type 4a pilus ATPase n=1 Tax=Rhodoferax sp. TaxID=50421 RepID=UPI002616B960|nr:PilT/PilU family type 4a pilus ATPase [Rhodoferax sp.]MDD5336146.1 PilT/PilU family type 4a pilus ATPase [Rhodoferax sp.]
MRQFESVQTPSLTDDLGAYLQYLVEVEGSDLFLTVGAVPTVKVEGNMRPMAMPPLAPARVKELAYSMMSESQMRQFEADLECDLAIGIETLGRFRLNVYLQRGEVGMVIRYVKNKIPSLSALKLPSVLQKLALLKRGLVLVVGAAGSGKSSTLAAMLDHRNEVAPGHILTIEDPIEFLHPHKKCVVDQREVGLDTHSFEDALRHAMREAPDVIMIGEIRDQITMQHAMNYAETGHLCLSTLHANNANQAIERIVNLFPEGSRKQILMDLSLNLKGVIAQRLIQGTDNRLLPATEIMLQSPFISDLIQKGQVDQIKAAIAKSTEIGMHTFDQSLFDLFTRHEITLTQAIDYADSKTDLSLHIRLSGGKPQQTPGLTIER